MGWWSSFIKGKKTNEEIKPVEESPKGFAWIKSWAGTTLKKVAIYVANTFINTFKQFVALEEAIPTLASEESLATMKAIGHIAIYKILPLLVINTANTLAKRSLQNTRDTIENPSWYLDAGLYLFTAIDWAVYAYTLRQSAELAVQTSIVNIKAPAVFSAQRKALDLSTNSHLPLVTSPCEIEHCTPKRKAKGALMQPFIQAFNVVLVKAINTIPYVGKPAATLLDIYFTGDLIARAALSANQCERHRTTHSEILLSLGLTHWAATTLMEHFLAATVGMPPAMVQYTFKTLLILWQINIATHMKIEYVEPGKGTLPIDPILAYEGLSRYVGGKGLEAAKDIMALFPPSKERPLISLPAILSVMTKVMYWDIKVVTGNRSRFFDTAKHILPPLFHNSYNAVQDPVSNILWSDIEELILEVVGYVEQAHGSFMAITNIPLLAKAVKEGLIKALYYGYGVSQNVTSSAINLFTDEDFAKFIRALKLWVEHHKILEKKALAPMSNSQLNAVYEGGLSTLATPEPQDLATVTPKPSAEVALVSTNSNQFFADPSTHVLDTRNIIRFDMESDYAPLIRNRSTQPENTSDGPGRSFNGN